MTTNLLRASVYIFLNYERRVFISLAGHLVGTKYGVECTATRLSKEIK